MESLAWICLLAPLAGVAVLTLLGSRPSRETSAWLGTLAAAVSFAAAVGAFAILLGKDPSQRHYAFTLFTWAGSGTLKVGFSVWVDTLSVTEMLIVSGVGALIVLYSISRVSGPVVLKFHFHRRINEGVEFGIRRRLSEDKLLGQGVRSQHRGDTTFCIFSVDKLRHVNASESILGNNSNAGCAPEVHLP